MGPRRIISKRGTEVTQPTRSGHGASSGVPGYLSSCTISNRLCLMETIKRHKVNYGEPVFFPELSTTPRRCVGQGYYLSQRERQTLDMHLAFLVRDRRNAADPNAVAVVRDDFRKVGYLSEAQARTFAPILDGLESLQVPCRVEGSRLWLDLPAPAELRKALRAPATAGNLPAT